MSLLYFCTDPCVCPSGCRSASSPWPEPATCRRDHRTDYMTAPRSSFYVIYNTKINVFLTALAHACLSIFFLFYVRNYQEKYRGRTTSQKYSNSFVRRKKKKKRNQRFCPAACLSFFLSGCINTNWRHHSGTRGKCGRSCSSTWCK